MVGARRTVTARAILKTPQTNREIHAAMPGAGRRPQATSLRLRLVLPPCNLMKVPPCNLMKVANSEKSSELEHQEPRFSSFGMYHVYTWYHDIPCMYMVYTMYMYMSYIYMEYIPYQNPDENVA